MNNALRTAYALIASEQAEPMTYEEYLESQVISFSAALEEMAMLGACYLDTHENGFRYQQEDGLGEQELTLMQNAAKERLMGALFSVGWIVERDEDIGVNVFNLRLGKRAYKGRTGAHRSKAQQERIAYLDNASLAIDAYLYLNQFSGETPNFSE